MSWIGYFDEIWKRGRKTHVPTYPVDPTASPKDPARCSKCGIELHRIMHYCCQRPDCPSGLGRSCARTTAPATERRIL